MHLRHPVQDARLRPALCTRCWSWLPLPVTSTPPASCPHPGGAMLETLCSTSTLPAPCLHTKGLCSRCWVPLTTLASARVVRGTLLTTRVETHVAQENESRIFVQINCNSINCETSPHWHDRPFYPFVVAIHSKSARLSWQISGSFWPHWWPQLHATSP